MCPSVPAAPPARVPLLARRGRQRGDAGAGAEHRAVPGAAAVCAGPGAAARARRYRPGAEGPGVQPGVTPGDTTRVPAEHYDAVTVVGALGEGQVPSSAVTELLRVTKPGEGVSPAVPSLPRPPDGRTGSPDPGRCVSPAGRWPCGTTRTWPCPFCQVQGCVVTPGSPAMPAGGVRRWQWRS